MTFLLSLKIPIFGADFRITSKLTLHALWFFKALEIVIIWTEVGLRESCSSSLEESHK